MASFAQIGVTLFTLQATGAGFTDLTGAQAPPDIPPYAGNFTIPHTFEPILEEMVLVFSWRTATAQPDPEGIIGRVDLAALVVSKLETESKPLDLPVASWTPSVSPLFRWNLWPP